MSSVQLLWYNALNTSCLPLGQCTLGLLSCVPFNVLGGQAKSHMSEYDTATLPYLGVSNAIKYAYAREARMIAFSSVLCQLPAFYTQHISDQLVLGILPCFMQRPDLHLCRCDELADGVRKFLNLNTQCQKCPSQARQGKTRKGMESNTAPTCHPHRMAELTFHCL